MICIHVTNVGIACTLRCVPDGGSSGFPADTVTDTGPLRQLCHNKDAASQPALRPALRQLSGQLSGSCVTYPTTANVWQTLNIDKPPGIPNNHFWSSTWSNSRTLFRSGLPNCTGATVRNRGTASGPCLLPRGFDLAAQKLALSQQHIRDLGLLLRVLDQIPSLYEGTILYRHSTRI